MPDLLHGRAAAAPGSTAAHLAACFTAGAGAAGPLLDSMPEGFVLLGPDGRVASMNAAAARLARRPACELVGLHPRDAFGAGAAGALAALAPHAGPSAPPGAPVCADSAPEFEHRFPDGAQAWFDLRATAAAGGATAVYFRDISARKRAELALRDANRRKDEFLAMLAHELRNPLAPISAAAELMQMAPLDETRMQRTCQVIARQVRHMTGLVDDLLDVSRVTRGLVRIDHAPQDINAIVSNAVEQVQTCMLERRHKLQITLAPGPVLVAGDQKRLVQVLTNLLSNAAKYTAACGEIALRIEADEREVTLCVSDNGIGIAPDMQARVFELFAQAERTADRAQGGLGLGLTLVRSLVELHGGSVRCDSAGPGTGSAFTVRLPRLRGAGADTAGGAPAAPAAARAAPAKRPLRILVVDDNVDAARMLAMYLEALGHHVMVETGSVRALALARAEQPDVCVLDIGLPEMNGHELAGRLRAQPETARAVMIAVTGYGQEIDRKNALTSGFDHHFVKPVDTAKLCALLEQVERRLAPAPGIFEEQ